MFEPINNYLTLPTVCEIDFSKKKSIINGCNSIISNISYNEKDTSLFKVKVLNKKNSFYVIFQKFNLYIVGLGLEEFGYFTKNLNEVRYLSYSGDIQLTKNNFFSAFDKVFFVINKNSSNEIFKFFNETKNSVNVRLLIFSLAETSKNDILRDSLIFSFGLTSFEDLKSDLRLFPSAIKENFYSYNNFLIFILNWKNLIIFRGKLLNKSLTISEVRNFFIKSSLVPKDLKILKGLGVFF